MGRAYDEAPIITAPNSLGIHDIPLSGGDLSWGAVDYVATNMVFKAKSLHADPRAHGTPGCPECPRTLVLVRRDPQFPV
jgi:hypothetical protein